jgi:hypothetical protein
VCILGHAGQILRSYLHDLCDHGIQAFIMMTRPENQFFIHEPCLAVSIPKIFGLFSDGIVAQKTKKIPMHEHKLAKKTLRDGSNGELTLEDRKRGLCSCTNIADGDFTKTHIVDIVVHLT